MNFELVLLLLIFKESSNLPFSSKLLKKMYDYLTNSFFVANLLSYLFGKLDIPWEHPYVYLFRKDASKFPGDNDACELVGEAVYTIWMRNHEDFYDCYLELREDGVINKEVFSKYAVSAASSYFSNGYNPGSFLGYCAVVLGVATSYYEFPENGIPEKAVEVIALILFAHQMTGQFYKHDGFDGLIEISQRFLLSQQSNFQ